MGENVIVGGFIRTRKTFFDLRNESGYVFKCNMAIIMACFTGLGAQIRIYTPFTPVPITGQVFFVLLSAVFLGKWWAGISQSLYVGIGLLGVPWFAPASGMPLFSRGGIDVIYGATAGYLIGFIIAAFVMGHILEMARTRSLPGRTGISFGAMMAGIFIIHAIGLLVLYLAVSSQAPSSVALATVATSVALFIPLDFLKAFFAGTIAMAAIPAKS